MKNMKKLVSLLLAVCLKPWNTQSMPSVSKLSFVPKSFAHSSCQFTRRSPNN